MNKNIFDIAKTSRREIGTLQSLPIYGDEASAIAGVNGVKIINNSAVWRVIGRNLDQRWAGGYGIANEATAYFTIDMGSPVLITHACSGTGGIGSAAYGANIKTIEGSNNNVDFNTLMYHPGTTAQDYDEDIKASKRYRYYRCTVITAGYTPGYYYSAVGAFNMRFIRYKFG